MRAVMPTLLPDVAAIRKRTGADRWDEIWNGVLHLPPVPNIYHQELEGELESWLRRHWARPRKSKVFHQVNLAPPGGWPDKNYRIPDLILLTPQRFGIIRKEYLEGAPDVAVEIHSPGDEAYEKLPFHAELGVPEVWIIDRDSKEPEIHVLKKGRLRKQRTGAGGWVRSPATGIEMKVEKAGKLGIRLIGDASTREDLPED